MTLAEQAVELQKSGYNCAQSVSLVFCEKYGFTRDEAAKPSANFGAGMAMGDLCGCLTGMLMVVGYKHGGHGPKDVEGKKLCRQEAKALIELFLAEHNTLRCADMLGCDITVGDNLMKAKPLIEVQCRALIARCVEILEGAGY